MNLDENAAAYGLFQLAFANLVERFAVALFCLQRIKNPHLQFNDVFARQFSCLRRELRKELKRFDNNTYGMEIADIRRACTQAGRLAAWRNPRIHARVKLDHNGISIYDQKTLKPLPIDRNESVRKIEEAIGITSRLDYAVGRLLRQAESHREINRLLREIFKRVEEKTD